MNLNEKLAAQIEEDKKNAYPGQDFVNASQKDSVEKRAKFIVEQLTTATRALTKKAKKDWRDAQQIAIDVENPDRSELYNIYKDALIDSHLQAVMMQRFERLVKERLIITDDNGEEDAELTKLLEKEWMIDFIRYAWESKAYGHSLIQFGNLHDEGFENVTLVPREHVIPQKGLVVKEIGDEKGIAYNKPPWNKWLIEVGKPDDLGFLLNASLETISKKYMAIFWDEFAEIFGVPMRIGKTSSTNLKERNNAAKMLKDMGTSAWGVFDDDTEIEIKESSNRDAFKVFDMRIQRVNSELSKLILGQTMTTDDGSSRSQSDTHESILEDILMSDKRFMKFVLNGRLKPFLISHGYDLDGKQFTYDESTEMSMKERMEVDKWLLQNFDIDIDYFKEHYNGYIKDVKAPAPGGGFGQPGK